MMEGDTNTPEVKTEEPQDIPRLENRKKFEIELEFVQSLAHPFYLHALAQQGYFEKPEFINYLRYLNYWRECVCYYRHTPLISHRREYIKFITYPHCLHNLDLLMEPSFREAIKHQDVIQALHRQQYSVWLDNKPQIGRAHV